MVAAPVFGAPIRMEDHQGLVRRFAGAFSNMLRGKSCLSEEDLMQAGNIGLARAIESYRPELGEFSTWAVGWIRNYVREEVRSHLGTVRGCRGSRWVAPKQPAPSTVPLYVSRGGIGGNAHNSHEQVPIMDMMPDRFEGPPTPEQHALTAERSAIARRLVRRLDCPRQRRVIRGRYFQGQTLEQLAKQMRVHLSRINQIETAAIVRLRELAEEV